MSGVAALALSATAAWADGVILQLPAQDLAQSLKQIARATGTNILFTPDAVEGVRGRALNGMMTAQEAVTSLIAGTSLAVSSDDNGGLIVHPKAAKLGHRAQATSSPQRMAQATSAAPPTGSSDAATGETAPVERVTVTGTRIRGSSPASPVVVIDRDAIDKSGAGTVQGVLSTLPQNFGGGYGDDNNVQLGAPDNQGLGSGVNLRGLGNGSTLVLLNGRRLPFNARGEFVDISMIPLSAVQRIEVMTDGASAIYGSDAIGGVVNIIMRTDYEGFETQARYGETAQGGGTETQASQVAGFNWTAGSAMIAYDYYKRDAISSRERDFAKGAPVATLLTPGSEKNSVFFSGRQQLTPGFEAFVDAYWSERVSDYSISIAGPISQSVSATSEQTGVIGGLRAELGGDWIAEASASQATNHIDSLLSFVGFPLPPTTLVLENTLESYDARADGSLFAIGGGDVRLALGASRRTDEISLVQGAAHPANDRDVSAVFGEVLIPLVTRENAVPGFRLLELSVAGRYEEYSDFGNTFNPKYGIRWSPFDDLVAHATYGTSFKAPTLDQINPYNEVTFLNAPPGALLRRGNNDDLTEETSKSWTVGFDYAPNDATFTFKGYYYSIEFEDRIATIPFFGSVTDPALAGYIVLRGEIPDAAFDALVADLLAHPPAQGFGGTCPPASTLPNGACNLSPAAFNAIVDNRMLNLAATNTDGIDLTATYGFETDDSGIFGVNANVVYTFNFEDKNTDGTPFIQHVDTVRNVPDLRTNVSLSWSMDGFSATGTVRYADDYLDNVAPGIVGIDEWTTFDLNLTYRTDDQPEFYFFKNLALSLTASNLFDEDPPFFANNPQFTNFDPSNADPVGRFVSFQVRKSW